MTVLFLPAQSERLLTLWTCCDLGAMATKVRRHDTRVHPYQRIVTADRGQFSLSAHTLLTDIDWLWCLSLGFLLGCFFFFSLGCFGFFCFWYNVTVVLPIIVSSPRPAPTPTHQLNGRLWSARFVYTPVLKHAGFTRASPLRPHCSSPLIYLFL